jgi:uncharacterized protein (DUF4213/DUF364 family)
MADIYEQLRRHFSEQVKQHELMNQSISIRCKALSASEAIGNPDHNDYPISKGKEVMVEAGFHDARGHAFTDTFEVCDYSVEELLMLPLTTNRKRASFIAGLNAVYRHLNLCDQTVHCRDAGPVTCAKQLGPELKPYNKILMVGFQPRFLDRLAVLATTRVVDIDRENIGRTVAGVRIESPEQTDEAIEWCDLIFATGSTIVNGSIPRFLSGERPVIFYGVTIAAPAVILNLRRYCDCGT